MKYIESLYESNGFALVSDTTSKKFSHIKVGVLGSFCLETGETILGVNILNKGTREVYASFQKPIVYTVFKLGCVKLLPITINLREAEGDICGYSTSMIRLDGVNMEVLVYMKDSAVHFKSEGFMSIPVLYPFPVVLESIVEVFKVNMFIDGDLSEQDENFKLLLHSYNPKTDKYSLRLVSEGKALFLEDSKMRFDLN